jgi:hypothetical protein
MRFAVGFNLPPEGVVSRVSFEATWTTTAIRGFEDKLPRVS